MKKLIFIFLLLFQISFKGIAQYKSPYENKNIDYKIIKSGNNYISSDSFYNKLITKVDTIDIEKRIEEGYFTRLFSKIFIILRVDSFGKLHYIDVSGSSMDYTSNPIKKIFKENRVEFRKDLLEDAKNKYIIQPLIVFSSDKKDGAFSAVPTTLLKRPYKDSLKIEVFYEALNVMMMPQYFISTPVSKKGWLTAVWLPTVYVNKGSNKYFWGAWYKELE